MQQKHVQLRNVSNSTWQGQLSRKPLPKHTKKPSSVFSNKQLSKLKLQQHTKHS